MTDYILAIILLLLAIGGVVVRKTYDYVPIREMKRQAERRDKLAVKLYPAVAYDSSLRALLWLFITLTSAGGFVLLTRIAPWWLGFVVVTLTLWLAFSWLPASRVTRIGARLTTAVTPALVWLLNWLHPVLSRTSDQVQKRYSAGPHTGMFEREDLLELLGQQQQQTDNRVTVEELEIAKRALNFGNYKVRDLLTGRSGIKTVAAADTVGPILIDELHKLEQPFVLVRGKNEHDIIGTLKIDELGIESHGKVRDVTDKNVCFLNEGDSLATALDAYYETGAPRFVVVNNFEEYIGIISIETILRELLGPLPKSKYDHRADLATVAKRHSEADDLDELADDQQFATAAELPEEPSEIPLDDESPEPEETPEENEATAAEEAVAEDGTPEAEPEPVTSVKDDDPDFEIIQDDGDDESLPSKK